MVNKKLIRGGFKSNRNKLDWRLTLIIGLIIGIIISVVGVYAATLVNSKDVIYDNSNSTLKSTNVQGALDELYDKTQLRAIDYISKLYNNGKKTLVTTAGEEKITQLASFGLMQDSFGNIRYYGSDPNNYVTFNNETAGWRIIGIFDTEDENGNVEKRVKLIRATSIGRYSWDNKDTSTGAEDDFGKNDWTTARLMKLLNPSTVYTTDSNDNGNGQSLYWNKTSGTCFSGRSNATTSCDFTSTGLTDKAKSQIDKVKYYLGGSEDTNIFADDCYNFERGTEVYSGRSTTWMGYIGLMYPSDYAYATDLSVCIQSVYRFNSDKTNCTGTDWLFDESGYNIWALNSDNTSVFWVFYVEKFGRILNNYYAYITNMVFPVLYLNPNIQIVSGTGTQSDPYQLK